MAVGIQRLFLRNGPFRSKRKGPLKTMKREDYYQIFTRAESGRYSFWPGCTLKAS